MWSVLLLNSSYQRIPKCTNLGRRKDKLKERKKEKKICYYCKLLWVTIGWDVLHIALNSLCKNYMLRVHAFWDFSKNV